MKETKKNGKPTEAYVFTGVLIFFYAIIVVLQWWKSSPRLLDILPGTLLIGVQVVKASINNYKTKVRIYALILLIPLAISAVGVIVKIKWMIITGMILLSAVFVFEEIKSITEDCLGQDTTVLCTGSKQKNRVKQKTSSRKIRMRYSITIRDNEENFERRDKS